MTSKKEIYKAYGVEFQAGKIKSSEFGFVNPLLINGNAKVGKGVYTYSTLPTNKSFTAVINGKEYTENGTCPCNCNGCYATKGFYQMRSTIESLVKKTYLARHEMTFTENAIKAQIKTDGIKIVRIHASGDFFSAEYVEMWKRIISECTETKFWTYTKTGFENAFDGFENANIVKSIIPNVGINFGKCEYIIKAYTDLKLAGQDVYICKCGIDKNQHCTNCKSCSIRKYVLFLEHSTDYKAESDPLFPILKDIIANQENEEC